MTDIKIFVYAPNQYCLASERVTASFQGYRYPYLVMFDILRLNIMLKPKTEHWTQGLGFSLELRFGV